VKIRPLSDRILVKPSAAEERTPGGIIIPDNAKETPTRGEVLAVGNGKILENGELRPLDVKPGNVVIYNKWGGTDVELDGEKCKILREDDIMAIEE